MYYYIPFQHLGYIPMHKTTEQLVTDTDVMSNFIDIYRPLQYPTATADVVVICMYK